MSATEQHLQQTGTQRTPDLSIAERAQRMAAAVDARLAASQPTPRGSAPPAAMRLRDALRPSRDRVPSYLRHLDTRGTVLELPTAVPAALSVKTPIRLKRRPVFCILCGCSAKERTYEVCSECFKVAKADAERAYVESHPEFLDLPLGEQEAILTALKPIESSLYIDARKRASYETAPFSYRNDPRWQRAVQILANRLKRANGLPLEPATEFSFHARSEVRFVTLADGTLATVRGMTFQERTGRYAAPLAPEDLAEELAPFHPHDEESDDRDGQFADDDYDGQFEDPEVGSREDLSAHWMPYARAERPTARREPGWMPLLPAPRPSRTPTAGMAVDRVAFLSELDPTSPYLDNTAIDTDEHAEALREDAARNPAPAPTTTRGGWLRTRTPDVCPECWTGSVVRMERTLAEGGETRTAVFYGCTTPRHACGFRMEEDEYLAFVDPNDQNASAGMFPGFVSLSRTPPRARKRPAGPRTPRPTSDAQIARWDAEVDALLRKGRIGPSLERAGLNHEEHGAWMAENRGAQPPQVADEPLYVRHPHPVLAAGRVEQEFEPYGHLVEIDGVPTWTDDHTTDLERRAEQLAHDRRAVRRAAEEIRTRDGRVERPRQRMLRPDAREIVWRAELNRRAAERDALRVDIAAAVRKHSHIQADLDRLPAVTLAHAA